MRIYKITKIFKPTTKIELSIFYFFTVLYLYIPILIFCLGWVKLYFAIPVIVATAIGIFFSMRLILRSNKGKECCNVIELFLIFIAFFLFFVVAGHSDLSAQDYDWHKHHAIFNDLYNYEWPVVYNNNSMLTYYLGQYMVPAFIGRCFHSLAIMKWMIPIWNALGLTIAYFIVCDLLKARTPVRKFIVFLFFVAWGGCTSIGSIIFNLIHSNQLIVIPSSFKWINMDAAKIHFASNYDALHDAFQHVITPWLSVCFFLGNKKHFESYMMISVPLLFSATFAFVYFIPILFSYLLWCMLKSFSAEQKKQVFSLGNFLILPILALLCVYFYSYIIAPKPNSIGFSITNFGSNWYFYFIFIVVEFLGYSALLFWSNRHNPLFYIINIELLIIPCFSLGMFNDLCSRGSIPARFILMIFCLDYLFSHSKKKMCSIGLIALVSSSMVVTGLQFVNHMQRTVVHWNDKSFISNQFITLEGFADNPNVRDDEAYNYYTLNYSDSLFYHISK